MKTLPAPSHMTAIDGGVINGIRWATVHAPIYGAVNGYVLVPKGHPWRDMDYDDIPVDVHGGLTYDDEDGWIGFDTLHGGDIWPGSPRYGDVSSWGRVWSEGMVADEAQRLALLVAEAATR